MDRNTSYLFLISIPIVAYPLISEWYSPKRDMHVFVLYSLVVTAIIFIILIMLLKSFIFKLIFAIPDKLKFFKDTLVKIISFMRSPFVKAAYFLLIVFLLIQMNLLIVKILLGIIIFILYLLELRQKQFLISGTQGKKPKFQDNFNNDSKNWDRLSGSHEFDANFGNPAPGVLLKQVGNQPATPQTFILLRNIYIKKPSTIECDVYIEPRGIFNLVFGISESSNSYFMARLDSRETEFDALLYKPEAVNWNFITRSDKYRTSWKTWHRLKLEIYSSKKVNLYKNGELIISRELEKSAFGKIGIMNEEADVHVDNVVITEI